MDDRSPDARRGIPSMMHTLPPTCVVGADAATDRADAELLAHCARWIDASHDLLDRRRHDHLARTLDDLADRAVRLRGATVHPAARFDLHRRLVAFLHDLTETLCDEATSRDAAAIELSPIR